MSYDLYFLKSKHDSLSGGEEFEDYFDARLHYKVNRGEFFYENQDTGVYFSFRFQDPKIPQAEPGLEVSRPDSATGSSSDGLMEVGLSFHLNYFRAHVFGLEAATELQSLVDSFGLSVDDPQSQGMGRAVYSREGFLKGWNAGNRLGYQVMVGRVGQGLDPGQSQGLATLPGAELLRTWNWNFHLAELQAELGRFVYVPRILFARIQGQVRSLLVWSDARPIALPQVDFVVLYRRDLQQDLGSNLPVSSALVSFHELDVYLRGHRMVQAQVPYALLEWDVAPYPLLNFFLTQPALEGKLDVVALDQILDQELVEEVLHL